MTSTKSYSTFWGVFLVIALGTFVSCRTALTGSLLQQQLINQAWNTTELMGVSLGAGDASMSSPSLNFESDGRLTGSTGCNSFMGTYSITGNKIKLDPGAMTKKFCEGDREQKFLEAVRKTTNLRMSGKRIDLVDDRDVVLMQLKPKN